MSQDTGTPQSWEIEKGAVMQEMRNLRASFDSLNDAIRGQGHDLTQLKLEHVQLKGEHENLKGRLQDLRADFEATKRWGMGILAGLITSGAAFAFSNYIHNLQQVAKP